MIAGSLGRLAYGAGLLVAPDRMNAWQLAADGRGDPYARMTTRAFGAVHVNVALLTLRAALTERDAALALGLNLGCDAGDALATVLEWRAGDLPAAALAASLALQSTGLTVWGAALRDA